MPPAVSGGDVCDGVEGVVYVSIRRSHGKRIMVWWCMRVFGWGVRDGVV